MYAKRICETRIECLTRPYLFDNGRIYTNPSDAPLRAAGYKPLTERSGTSQPLSPFTVFYEEDDFSIYTCYKEVTDI